MKTVKAAIEVNATQKYVLSQKARKYYEDFGNLTIAVLGLTFKPGTDDLREAPSLVNIPVFLDDGAYVKAWDPVGVDNFKKWIKDENLTYCDTVEETLQNADICFIFTEWPEVKETKFDIFEKLMKKPIIMDGRNCFLLDDARASHVIYESIGREIISTL